MTTCANCGAPLGVGRFCTNCGHRVGVPVADAPRLHDTAERPAVPAAPTADPAVAPQVVPPAHEPPPPARFPLFADEPPGARSGPDVTLTDLPVITATPLSSEGQPRRRRGVLWTAAAAVLVLVAAIAVAATRGGDDGFSSADSDAPAAGAGPTSAEPSSRPRSDDADGPAPTDPRGGRDLSSRAQVTAPPPGPPSSDVASGRTVTYVAANMLDGDPTTCWRTPGDATGAELVFTLPAGSTITSVSLINGYAKTSRAGGTTYDWYEGNRRVLRAEWTFDDGTTVAQDLIDTRDPQRLDVGSIVSDTVRLRLVEVSPPGTGPAAKDNTAISEVTIRGM